MNYLIKTTGGYSLQTKKEWVDEFASLEDFFADHLDAQVRSGDMSRQEASKVRASVSRDGLQVEQWEGHLPYHKAVAMGIVQAL